MRIEYPGAVYHITSRGNRRGGIFLDNEDREVFFSIFAEAARRFHVLCHAYCLMGNHYHLVVETMEGNLSSVMRHLNGVYTQVFNRLHGKCGHVFQGRYKAILIDKSSYLLEACRYVVLNPVRAKLCASPADWPWSSYRGTAGIGKKTEFLTTEWLLSQFDENRAISRGRYVDFVSDRCGGDLWRNLVSGIVLGDGDFAGRCMRLAHGDWDASEIPVEQRYADRPELAAILDGAGLKWGNWRKAVDEFGYTQKEVAVKTGMHYSYVSRVLKRERSKVKT